MAKRNQPPVNIDRPRTRSRSTTEPPLLSRWPSPILNQHLNWLEDITGVPTHAAAAAPTSPPPQLSPMPPVPSPTPNLKEQFDQMSRRMDIFASIFSEMRRRLSEGELIQQEQKIRELSEANEEMIKVIAGTVKTIAGNVTSLAGDVHGLTEAQARAGHPPPPPPPPPPQPTPPPGTLDREITKIVRKKVLSEEDNYFCNTINIKGFTPETWSYCMDRLNNTTPRKLEVDMLKCDVTEHLVYDAIQIKFM